MKKAGWILLAVAFAIVLFTKVSGRGNMWLLFTLLIAIFLGLALICAAFAARLYRGDVKFRPWDAAKSAVVTFLVVLALRLLIQAVSPSLDFELSSVVIWSATFAVVYGLSTTAYRKPT